MVSTWPEAAQHDAALGTGRRDRAAGEAVGVLTAALIAGVDAISGQAYRHASGIAITVIGIATAVALAYVARG